MLEKQNVAGPDEAIAEPDEDSEHEEKYKYLKSKVDEHSGILGELKEMLGGFISASNERHAANTKPATPDEDSPKRAAPKKRKQWF